ncbi:MAG: hypothetical protein IPJ06_16805 [Saprospiraceae bacterium]|nr:hypothetical protein [Saprospiraceae bacterium]
MLVKKDQKSHFPDEGGGVMEFTEPNSKDQLERVVIGYSRSTGSQQNNLPLHLKASGNLEFSKGCHEPDC